MRKEQKAKEICVKLEKCFIQSILTLGYQYWESTLNMAAIFDRTYSNFLPVQLFQLLQHTNLHFRKDIIPTINVSLLDFCI